jgi:pyridinium-3,5-bisthiocarboxylic acid mononucleotide nickel chelatase
LSTIAYFDCFSGASGDMILGALVDAGWPLADLEAVVVALGLAGECQVAAETVRRGAMRATQVHVDVVSHSNHHARHLGDILALIDGASLPDRVRAQASAVFRRLGEAEAHVHGIDVEAVHFHEVGAVDALVDVVGVAAGLAALDVQAAFAAPLPLARGTVHTQHGLLPLPAPATLELVSRAGAPTRPVEFEAELVTPTGAAILTTLASFSQPSMRLHRIGIGAGGRDDLPWPNVLRLWLGESIDAPDQDGEHVLIETNIDNMPAELFGHAMSRLFAAGALDVFFVPIQMKKDRPGTLLGVIARRRDEAALAELILRETTTLGVRVQPVRRYEAGREQRRVETEYGEVQVKVKILDGRPVAVTPEYEDCRRLAVEYGVPLAAVYAAVACGSAFLVSGS